MQEHAINRFPILDSSFRNSGAWKNKISISSRESKYLDAKQMAIENAVIVFCRHGCCVTHVMKCLLQVLGVNPKVFEVFDADMESQLIAELKNLISDGKESQQGENTLQDLNLHAVFIGGKLFGGVERVVATHITGDLVPILKDVGASWLGIRRSNFLISFELSIASLVVLVDIDGVIELQF